MDFRCHRTRGGRPLPPGKVGPQLTVGAEEFRKLVRLAAPVAAGGRPGVDAVAWRHAGNELVVEVGGVEVGLDRGIVVLRVPVRCDQVSRDVVTVPFAVGEKERPAGMLVATEERPRGDPLVVDVWGEALVTFAWQTLLAVVEDVAARGGVDLDGKPLIPAGLTADRSGVRVLSMARHPFDPVSP